MLGRALAWPIFGVVRDAAIGEQAGVGRVRQRAQFESALLHEIFGGGALAAGGIGKTLRRAFQNAQIRAGAEDEQIRGHALRGTIGAGEIAMVAATGSRSAMRIAIAAPIEWPSKIVLLGSIWSLRIRDSTAAVAHSCAWAKENASRAVAVAGKVESVGAEAVAGEIFGEIHHQAAIGGESVQQDDAAGRFYIRGRIENCHRRVASACVEPQFLLRKFGDANPARAEREEYDADDGENDLPELHGALRGICAAAW